MLKQFTSLEQLSTTTSIRNKKLINLSSPYSKQYKTNITHDQRDLLAQRQQVIKLQRKDLEDRYLELLDEHFQTKKENLNNHDKIKKLATKLLRISSETKIKTASTEKLTPDETLQIRIIELESINAQLLAHINTICRKVEFNTKRSSSSRGILRSSSANLQLNHKLRSHSHNNLSNVTTDIRNKPLSVELLHTTENIIIDNEECVSHRSSNGENIDPQLNDNVNNDEINVNNELRHNIESLKNELIEEKQKSTKILNEKFYLEEQLSQEISTTKHNENLEITKMNGEIERLRKEIEQLNCNHELNKTQNDLIIEKERNQLVEIQTILNNEIEKTKQFTNDKEKLEAQIKSLQYFKEENISMTTEIDSLRKHQETVSKLASELAAKNQQIFELLKSIDKLNVNINERQTYEDSLKLSQNELIQKIRILQDKNDELLVQIEGYRTECQCMRDENNKINILIEKYKNIEIENLKLIENNANKEMSSNSSSNNIYMNEENTMLKSPITISASKHDNEIESSMNLISTNTSCCCANTHYVQCAEGPNIQNNENEIPHPMKITGDTRISNILSITDGQGTFEIHIEKFILSNAGKEYLTSITYEHNKCDANDTLLYFGWNFYNKYTKTLMTKGPDFNILSTKIYTIQITNDFFNYLNNKSMKIVLFKFSQKLHKEYVLGYTEINFNEILMYPENKIQIVTQILSMDSDCNCTKSNNNNNNNNYVQLNQQLGNLILWFRLTCNHDAITKFLNQEINQSKINTYMHHDQLMNNSIENEIINQLIECKSKVHDKRKQIPTMMFNNESVREHNDHHNYEFAPKKLLKKKNAISDKKLKYKDCLEKYIYKLQVPTENLETSSISSAELSSLTYNRNSNLYSDIINMENNIDTVTEYMDNNSEDSDNLIMLNVQKKQQTHLNLPDKIDNVEGMIKIEIISLDIIHEAELWKDHNIKQLYIEYSFLGEKGYKLETPVSLPKPCLPNSLIVYNFRKTFELNQLKHQKQLKILTNMLNNPNEKMKFIVINEPTEIDMEINKKLECFEIAFGTFKFGKLVMKSISDRQRFQIYMYAMNNPLCKVAKLELNIEGISFMKNVSLLSNK